MPSRGDLLQQARDIHNPFAEELPRVNEYTAQEIATLQSRLDKQLGPEYISTRKGPGGVNVHYLAAEKVIALANEVFGFNGWSSGIRETTIDYVDIDKDGKVSMGISIIMRITLRDGTYHEDIGYGTISNCSGKGPAFEKSKKEAATDAMKRALRSFGNVLGNCLYDKEYLKRIVKVKAPPSKWNADELYRHHEFVAPPKPSDVQTTPPESVMHPPPTRTISDKSRGSTDYDDEFGGNAFEDLEFTRSDEFLVLEDAATGHPAPACNDTKRNSVEANARQAPQRAQSTPQTRHQVQQPSLQPTDQPRPRPLAGQRGPIVAASGPDVTNMSGPKFIPQFLPTPQVAVQQGQQAKVQPHTSSVTPESVPNRPQIQRNTTAQPMPETPVGFVKGRAAEMLIEGKLVDNAAFDPHAESPSIRKTTGFNHRVSGPVRRDEALGRNDTVNQPARTVPGQTTAPHNGGPHPSHPTHPQQAGPGAVQSVTQGSRPNFVNPHHDPHRRIGAPLPAGPQSPGPRAGAYRPPGPAGVKRPLPEVGWRPPLGDVSNANRPAPADGGGEKRLRANGPEDVGNAAIIT